MKIIFSAAVISLLFNVAAAQNTLSRVTIANKKNTPAAKELALNKWSYIEVDNARDKYVIPGAQAWWGYFGLDMFDVNSDGFCDIVSGEWYYRNPGGDMSQKWQRITFPLDVDAVLAFNVDDDAFADVIGLRFPAVYWLEANDLQGNSWSYTHVGTMLQTGHANSQEYSIAQIVPGGKPEFLLYDEVNQYYFEIPANPANTPWKQVVISSDGGGYSTGDIDGDGWIDLVGGYALPGEGKVMEGTWDVKKNNRMIAWWKNPGDGSSNWKRFDLGKGTSPERYVVADLDGDGKPDVATSDERYPGNVRNAYLTIYHHPGNLKKAWKKNVIAVSKSMNSMDGADMDNDGDIDLIVGEHEMPGPDKKPLPHDERVLIYENDGRGNFEPTEVDLGKESHLGTRVADMDGDGDPDIVSIGWRDYKLLHLWRNDAVPPKVSNRNTKRKFGLDITVDANGFERIDKPVEVPLNFTALLAGAELKDSVSLSSLVLYELNSGGQVIDPDVPYQFDTAIGYDNSKNALGTLVFLMKGTTRPYQSRYFKLYFDNERRETRPTKNLIHLSDIGVYEGQPTFKIKTPNSEYYYHQTSGGFASLKDRDNNDWISYHPDENIEGFKGRYRGIPNIAPPEFHPGEPKGKKPAVVVSQGCLKVSIVSVTEDGQWKSQWDIYPGYATMSLLKKDTMPYWILYEGTPGGEFNEQDFWVQSDGQKKIMEPYRLKSQWTGKLPSPKWVYFGDHRIQRVMYYIHHEDYEYDDVFWHSGEGGMTVFGFGRGPDRTHWQQLTKAPAQLTVGFSESSDFNTVKRLINSSYKSLRISIGNVIIVK
ncbi:MAG: VCBS repeat-containing protein [Chitinophagaceae bacterium]|nr:VCBS repeat-containing protein [Chitinophagaceae bacterium]